MGKIYHFEFLVMTEKNIFAYKLLLSLNMSDSDLFFMWKLQPPPLKKVTSSFPATPLWKLRSCQTPPPFWKFGWRLNPLCRKGEGGGVHTKRLQMTDRNLFFVSVGFITQFSQYLSHGPCVWRVANERKKLLRNSHKYVYLLTFFLPICLSASLSFFNYLAGCLLIS